MTDDSGHLGEPPIGPDAARRLFAALREPEEVARCADAPVIPGYHIVCRIGGGGGGVVYEASRDGGSQRIALKILHRGETGATAAQRAWRELELMRNVRATCLPRLIDYGEIEGRLWIATEYIEGASLGRHADSLGLDRRARVELLAGIADGVQSLHENGIIHRDLKPSNVLVRPDGTPVIIDLGVAAIDGDGGVTLTETGTPVGSPLYMAPEQARGDRGAITTRSDVYGLGAIGFTLLTGEPPHESDATLHALIRRAAQDEVRDPRQIDATCPRPLAAVLRKATAYRAADRYASAAAFAADLRRWLRGEPVEAGELTFRRAALRWAGRHPVGLTVAVCFVVGLATVASTIVSIQWINNRPARLVPDGDRRSWAKVESWGGRILHQWEGGGVGGITAAIMLDRPDELGGGKVAVVGFGGEWSQVEAGHDVSGRICIYDLTDLKNPVWMSGRTETELSMPAPISNVRVGAFYPKVVITADVFPDLPGIELVVAHVHYDSPVAISIYRLDGTLLYRAWNDGHISDLHWLPGPGLLAGTGYNSEASWERRGEAPQPNQVVPRVIFALRPEVGVLHDQYLHTPGGRGVIEPEWYFAIGSPEAVSQLAAQKTTFDLESPRSGFDGSACVQLNGYVNEGVTCTFTIILDAHGNEVPDSRAFADTFLSRDDLPDPDAIWIRELPPIVDRE